MEAKFYYLLLGDYRSLSATEHAMKILERIVDGSLSDSVDDFVPERYTTDAKVVVLTMQ